MLVQRSISASLVALALLAGAPAGLAQESEPVRPTPRQPATQPDKPAPKTEAPAESKWQIGKAAPAFTVKDLDGKEHTLAQHKGEIVVLVWWNPTCAEVRHQFLEGPMKYLPAQFRGLDVRFMAVSSTPEGQDGGGAVLAARGKLELGMTMPILMDSDGVMAKAYHVEKAPTVFVIDDEGILVYAGAIDNAPNGILPEDAPRANYLRDAIRATLDGEVITTTTTKPYGCNIAKPTARG